jgi:sirohydrochlorin ferrochelatase
MARLRRKRVLGARLRRITSAALLHRGLPAGVNGLGLAPKEALMPAVLIVAHGQPSDPAPAAAELAGFAAKVAALCPDRDVASVTLAEPGGLAKAVARLGPNGRVFPLFMAGGWFARVHLPAKLREAGAMGWQVLEPFGCDPALADLTVSIAREAGARQIILAAHGSFKSTVPSDIAYAIAARIAQATGAEVRAGFIDQDPQLQSLTGFGEICLPFFAAAGGHVTEDIPAALAKAGFAGRILPPVGLDARAPTVVARAILADQPVCSTACRYQR